ncbi:MAG: hypothetical protein ABI230_02230, partial [Aestuariivirga sp.]
SWFFVRVPLLLSPTGRPFWPLLLFGGSYEPLFYMSAVTSRTGGILTYFEKFAITICNRRTRYRKSNAENK